MSRIKGDFGYVKQGNFLSVKIGQRNFLVKPACETEVMDFMDATYKSMKSGILTIEDGLNKATQYVSERRLNFNNGVA